MRFISNELCCCNSFWRVCREIRSIYNCVFTDQHARHNEMGSAIGCVHLAPPSCFILTISPCGTCSSELISCFCPSPQTWNFIILHCYAHICERPPLFIQYHVAKKLRRVKRQSRRTFTQRKKDSFFASETAVGFHSQAGRQHVSKQFQISVWGCQGRTGDLPKPRYFCTVMALLFLNTILANRPNSPFCASCRFHGSARTSWIDVITRVLFFVQLYNVCSYSPFKHPQWQPKIK